jgi:hypothetical protein
VGCFRGSSAIQRCRCQITRHIGEFVRQTVFRQKPPASRQILFPDIHRACIPMIMIGGQRPSELEAANAGLVPPRAELDTYGSIS